MTSARRAKAALETRVELQLHDHASVRQHRELGAFVRYCIARIERDVGTADWWVVKIVPDRCAYTCIVTAENADVVLQATRTGADATLAAWDALCKIEQLILEDRARRVPEGADRAVG
jgi:hypothetical protein